MASIKATVGTRPTKDVEFMGSTVTITKLSVQQAMDIEKLVKKASEDTEGKKTTGLDLIKGIIKMSVEGANELTDKEFQDFPLDDLNKLSEEITAFSGFGGNEVKPA